jgi:hypothetical protein
MGGHAPMSERPRLVVPGVVELVPTYVGAAHDVVVGPLAGHQLDEDITNWKNQYTFVALADLTLEDRIRYAPRFEAVWRALASSPSSYREGGAPFPHLTRLFASAELLLVGSTDRRDVGSAGHIPLDGPYRIFEIGYVRTADDYFQLRATRGKRVLAQLSGSFYSFTEQVWPDPEEADATRGNLGDRILRAATGGVVSGAQIALAFMMVDVASAEAWESWLAAVEARAEPHRALADDLVRAVAQGDAEVAIYGAVRRIDLPACTLRSSDSKDPLAASVDVAGASELTLPAERLFTVDVDADAEPPRMPRELFAQRVTPPRAKSGLAGVLLISLFLFVLALVVRHMLR